MPQPVDEDKKAKDKQKKMIIFGVVILIVIGMVVSGNSDALEGIMGLVFWVAIMAFIPKNKKKGKMQSFKIEGFNKDKIRTIIFIIVLINFLSFGLYILLSKF